MKKIFPIIVSAVLFMLNAGVAKAQSMPFSIEVRAGVNSSAQSVNFDELFSGIQEDNVTWKAGYQVGVIVDMKMSSRVALQPGFFYKKSSYDYFTAAVNDNGRSMRMASGEASYSSYQIPVLVSYRLNLSAVEWQIDAGPYVSFGSGGDNKLQSTEINVSGGNVETRAYKYKNGFYDDSDGLIVGCDKFDWGLKFGTGFKVLGKYYIGVHYNAGLRNVGKQHADFNKKVKVKNKSLDFSLGYSF